MVRGRRFIGAVAAYGIVLAARRSTASTRTALVTTVRAAALLSAARPTAANLTWGRWPGLDRVGYASVGGVTRSGRPLRSQRIAREDVWVNQQLGLNALPLIPERRRYPPLANTGALATVDVGTALGLFASHRERQADPRVGRRDQTAPPGCSTDRLELRDSGFPTR